VIETEKYIGIVFEYASGGELFDHILAHRYLKEKDACKLFAQLISGVHYIHQKKVVHRDLKLETLFLDRHRNLIISDFGLANRFEQDDLMQTSCGSPWYAAPELVISDDKYVGTAVDIWSCGVILYAMLAGYLPFDDDPANPEGDNILLLYQYIVNTPLTFPDYISKEARDLLELMLVPDPAHRGTLEQVMAHHWLEPYAHLFVKSVDELERAAIDQLQLQRQALDRTTRPHARTLSQAASTSPGQTAQSATSKEKTKSSESVRHTTQVEFGETREDEPTAMPDATLDRPQLGRQQPPVNAVNKALPSVLGQPSVAASRSWSEPGPPPSSMDRAQLQPVEPLVAPAVHIASTSSPATSSVESSSFGSTSSPTPVAVSSAYTASARSDLGSPETPGSRPVVRFAGARDAVDIPLVPSGAGEDPARCADKDERAEIEAERRHEHGTSVERLGPNKILGSAEPFAPASAASSHGASDGAFVETPASEEDDGTWYKPQTTSKDAPASPMEVPGLGQGTPTASGTARKVMNWFLTKSAGEGDATSVAPIVVMSPAGPHARKESGTAKQLAPALRGSKPLPTLSAARTLGDRMRESLNIGVPRRLSAASTIRLHHGAVDQMMLVTNANPLEVMAHMRVVLQGIGVELHVETEYKYRCVRPKRKERPAKSSAGPGAATFKFVGSVGFSGVGISSVSACRLSLIYFQVNRRGLPAPSRNLFSGTGKLRGLFMRRQPSQVLAMAHPISLVQTSPPPSTLELSPSSTLELSPSSTLEFSPSATLKLSPDEHTIYGDRNQDLGDEIRFSIELTKMDRLSDMYSITMRRLKGNLRSYKFVYNTVRECVLFSFFVLLATLTRFFVVGRISVRTTERRCADNVRKKKMTHS
jgi:serine/threonine protein kinase